MGAVILAGTLALAVPVGAAQPGGPVPVQVGPPATDTGGPGGGIGGTPGGDRTTTTTEGDDPAPPTTEQQDEPTPTTAGDREEQGPGTPLGGAGAGAEDGAGGDDEDGGTSLLALAAVGFLGLVLGLLLAAVPLGAALARSRRRPPPAPSPYAPGTPGAAPPPPGAGAGPVVGAAPSREEAQARSQRAALAEALMDLRQHLPSPALSDEAARALAAVGITELRPDGHPFDPARHRAVDQVATDDPARHNTVVATERPGYADGDRVVRQPEVVVARHPEGA